MSDDKEGRKSGSPDAASGEDEAAQNTEVVDTGGNTIVAISLFPKLVWLTVDDVCHCIDRGCCSS